MVWTIPVGEVAGMMLVSFSASGQPASDAVPVQTPSGSKSATVTAPPEPTPAPAGDPTPPVLPDAPLQAAPEPEPEPAVTAPPPGAADPFPPAVEAPSTQETYAPTLPPLGEEEVDDEIPGPAAEEPERLLRPSDKRRFFSMSIGGATAGGYGAYYGSKVDFQVEGLIGAFAKRRPNFGGGFVMQYRKGLISEIGLAGRFIWDKSLSKRYPVYTSVDTTIGINVPVSVGGYFYGGIPSAQLGVGWGIKAILAERVSLGFRPVAPSLVAPDFYSGGIPVRIRWDFGVSLGIVW